MSAEQLSKEELEILKRACAKGNNVACIILGRNEVKNRIYRITDGRFEKLFFLATITVVVGIIALFFAAVSDLIGIPLFLSIIFWIIGGGLSILGAILFLKAVYSKE